MWEHVALHQTWFGGSGELRFESLCEKILRTRKKLNATAPNVESIQDAIDTLWPEAGP